MIIEFIVMGVALLHLILHLHNGRMYDVTKEYLYIERMAVNMVWAIGWSLTLLLWTIAPLAGLMVGVVFLLLMAPSKRMFNI